MQKGIDISVWQGPNIDFNAVKNAGYDFVIIRAGYGKYEHQKDPYFEQNYKNAKSAGLGVGAYWYSYATNVSDAKEEARVFCDILRGKEFEYPAWLDIEDPSQQRLSNRTINQICKTFCSYLEERKFYTGVYSFLSFLNRLDENTLKAHDIWVAQWGVEKTSWNGNYGMWQYSDKGKVSGIAYSTDLNYSYKNYPAIMKSNGLNGFVKQEVKPTPTQQTQKPVEKLKEEPKTQTITYTVKYGDTLIAIAKKFGTTVIDIAKENKIANVNLIYAGQKLKITIKN